VGNKCPELREHRDLSTYGRKIYNARTETVAKLPSFREAWSKRWRCIIPTEHFFEPCWETGKSFRWLIQQHGEVPMGIADIYRKWRDPKGNPFMQGLGDAPDLGRDRLNGRPQGGVFATVLLHHAYSAFAHFGGKLV
jgi:hypothetical protein